MPPDKAILSDSTLTDEKGGTETKPTPVVPDHQLIRCIGQGGYGEVWLARNALGTYRAVKVIYRSSFKDERVYEREFRGIQMFEPISRSNDGLLDILQAGRNDRAGYYYYVMELADDSNAEGGMRNAESNGTESEKVGKWESEINTAAAPTASLSRLPTFSPAHYVSKTLGGEIQRRGRLPADECVQLGLNLTMALGHLHRHGLIHRDIKPANIIFVQGIPKLADIGLVTTFDETCSFVGTEGYIPPEGPTSPRADLFSLGKVLYEISTGKDRKDFPEPVTGMGEQADQGSDELNAVILKACAPDSEQRYQTAEEFHADLALLQSGKSVRWKRVMERRLDFARKTLAVVGALALVATAGYFFQRRQTQAVERNLYVANMTLAQRNWDTANLEQLSQLLDETESYLDKGFEWYYWQRQLHLDLKTLRGHSAEVTSLAYSPDGQRLVTGSEDHTVRIWDVASGRQLLLINGHRQRVASVAFSPDGRQIVTGSWDGTARIWDALTGEQQMDLEGHTGMVFGVAISPDGQRIATVSRYSNGALAVMIAVWDAASGQKLEVYGEDTSGVGAVSFSPDGQRIAATADLSTVKIWEVASGRELFTCRSQGQINFVAFSPDGKHLVTGGGRETAVWDASSGEQLHLLKKGGVSSVAYSPDGKRIAGAGGDTRVIVWDAATGTELFRLAGHCESLKSVAFSPDSLQIATASGDGTVKIWDVNGVKNPRTFPEQTKQISMLVVSPDGTRVATTTWDKKVRIWEVATGRKLLDLTGIVHEMNSLAFSPDGQRLATGNGWQGQWGGQATIWDCATGEEVLALDGNGFVAFSPDGRRIATSSRTNTATIWNAASGAELVSLAGHSQWVLSGAFSPDGKRIVTSSEDFTVKLWDANTGRELLSIQRPQHIDQNLSSVVLSPDGKRIGLANGDRTPRVFDADTGRELLALNGHKHPVLSIAYSPDGRRVVTASSDGSAKVWDAFTGRELLTLEGHTLPVRVAAFAPDDNSIVTAGWDGLIKIWEAASAAQVADWRQEEREVEKLWSAPAP